MYWISIQISQIFKILRMRVDNESSHNKIESPDQDGDESFLEKILDFEIAMRVSQKSDLKWNETFCLGSLAKVAKQCIDLFTGKCVVAWISIMWWVDLLCLHGMCCCAPDATEWMEWSYLRLALTTPKWRLSKPKVKVSFVGHDFPGLQSTHK